MDTEEGEVVQGKVKHNIYKIRQQKISQILRKFCPFRYRKPPGYQADVTKIEPPHSILSLKQENKERILKALREKKQIKYKSKPIKITADFSTQTLKIRKAWITSSTE
jgi:hypothetical protein